MVDMDATSDLLKQIFKVIYVYYLLCKLSLKENRLEEDLYRTFYEIFKFPKIHEAILHGNYKEFLIELPLKEEFL